MLNFLLYYVMLHVDAGGNPVRPASICSMHSTVKTLSDLLHLHCGTASQIISGLRIASLNSRVFCSPGMGPNVAVLHVDD